MVQSIRRLSQLGKRITGQCQDGIAHFLEHKLFEKKDYDAFESLVATGQAQMRLRVLRERVIYFQQPVTCKKIWIFYLILCRNLIFNSETVEKKVCIIGQEIQMYNDEPDWRLFYMIGNLYPVIQCGRTLLGRWIVLRKLHQKRSIKHMQRSISLVI